MARFWGQEFVRIYQLSLHSDGLPAAYRLPASEEMPMSFYYLNPIRVEESAYAPLLCQRTYARSWHVGQCRGVHNFLNINERGGIYNVVEISRFEEKTPAR